jgi:hypothetical protein
MTRHKRTRHVRPPSTPPPVPAEVSDASTEATPTTSVEPIATDNTIQGNTPNRQTNPSTLQVPRQKPAQMTSIQRNPRYNTRSQAKRNAAAPQATPSTSLHWSLSMGECNRIALLRKLKLCRGSVPHESNFIPKIYKFDSSST